MLSECLLGLGDAAREEHIGGFGTTAGIGDSGIVLEDMYGTGVGPTGGEGVGERLSIGLDGSLTGGGVGGRLPRLPAPGLRRLVGLDRAGDLRVLYAGVLDALAELSDRRVPVGVVTNLPGWIAEPLLLAARLDTHLRPVVSYGRAAQPSLRQTRPWSPRASSASVPDRTSGTSATRGSMRAPLGPQGCLSHGHHGGTASERRRGRVVKWLRPPGSRSLTRSGVAYSPLARTRTAAAAPASARARSDRSAGDGRSAPTTADRRAPSRSRRPRSGRQLRRRNRVRRAALPPAARTGRLAQASAWRFLPLRCRRALELRAAGVAMAPLWADASGSAARRVGCP